MFCEKCSGSGIYVSYNFGYEQKVTTGNFEQAGISVPCKYCNGKGSIDENEFISVPRKFVKDEYFENRKNYG